MKLSVVIPTWNEEAWIPYLLKDLEAIQGIDETIFVDNYSTDATISIAQERGYRVLHGGKPAIARNIGASETHGDVILFLDADVLVTQNMIDNIREGFASSNQIVAIHFALKPLTGNRFCLFCFQIMNTYFNFLSRLGIAQGIGSCFAVRKSVFDYIEGFNENILAAEDLDIFRRLNKIGSVKFVHEVEVGVSARRFEVENPIVFALKSIIWATLRLCGTKVSIFSYRWKSHQATIAQGERG